MIVEIEELMYYKEFENISTFMLTNKINAIENKIKKYTNNNFVNRKTKQTEYPPDVKEGVINLLKWEFANRDKVGIKSESISRHSVTYYDQDSNNTVLGYPASLLGFLKPYMKARF